MFGSEVINLDILVRGSNKVYTDVALWDEEAHALLDGQRLNEDMTAWENFQPPIKIGTNVMATGRFEWRKWKATKSKAIKKNQKKGHISVYSHEQLKVIALPKR